MVRRLIKYTLWALLVLTVAAASLLFWLLGTTAGGKWLLGLSSIVEVRQLSGRLAGDLALEGVRIHLPQAESSVRSVRLRWNPLALVKGQLQVEELAIAGVDVRLLPSEKKEPSAAQPAAFFWPRLSGLPARFDADLESVLVEGLSIRQEEKDLFSLNRLDAALRLRNGVVSVDFLKVESPLGEGELSAEAGFVAPLLRLEGRVRLAKGIQGLDGLRFEADLGPAAEDTLAGGLTLRALGGETDRLRLESELSLKGERLSVSRLVLTRPSEPGTLEAQGMVTLSNAPRFQVKARIAELDLSGEIGRKTDLSGSLEVEGILEDYRGRFGVENRVEGWEKGALSAQFSGDLQGIALRQIRGEWLRGNLGGDAEAAWGEELAVHGNLTGKGLDPSVITPEWPGDINLESELSLRRGKDAQMRASIKARLRDSSLRGKELIGRIDADLAGKKIAITELDLQGDGFRIEASGLLEERLDLEADIQRLGGLIPGAQGHFKAAGWFRWSDGGWAGELHAGGGEISLTGANVDRLDLSAAYGGGEAPMTLSAELRGVNYGRYEAETASVDLKGVPARHQAALELRWTGGEGALELDGGIAGSAWEGEITRLWLKDESIGSWHLGGPAGLELSASRLTLKPVVLVGSGEGQVVAYADLGLKPLQGQAGGGVKGIDLALLNPWLPEMTLEGVASGKASVEWNKGAPVRMAGKIDLSGQVVKDSHIVRIDELASDIDWNFKGLAASIDLALAGGGRLEAGVFSSQPVGMVLPKGADFHLEWQKLALEDLNPWIPEVQLSGNSSGEVSGQWDVEQPITLRGQAAWSGKVVYRETALEISRTEIDVELGREKLAARLLVESSEGGSLLGEISTTAPRRPVLPDAGTLDFSLQNIDLGQVRPWLPPSLRMEGRLAGGFSGRWLQGGKVQMKGKMSMVDGRLEWKERGQGTIGADVKTAEVTLDWSDHALNGDLVLALSEFGRAEGSFQIPLAARFPLALDPAGPVRGRLSANMEEKGVLSALLPGVIQESRGEVELDLRIGGQWKDPQLEGRMQLQKAGAYLPDAGIHLEDLTLKAVFDGDRIRVETFSVDSGSGRLEGSGSLQLKNWLPDGYQASIKGQDFHVINLPELRVVVNPDLEIEGTLEKLIVRGEIHLPDVLVTGRQNQTLVRQSPDVVLVDAAGKETEKTLPMKLDIRVQVVLGDHVLVKISGVDARLEGGVTLHVAGRDDVTAQGEIRVAQGAYSAYGVKLDITRGKVFFAGGPVDRPTLDILALREVGEVKAGVQVTGTPRAPNVKLYSEPAMADTDVLAYVVLGHPLGTDRGQANLLLVAASALLSKGESAVLQDRVKRRLGLDVLEIQQEQLTRQGQQGEEEVSSTVITVGKYLSPKLYVSLGHAFQTDTNEVRLRYSISDSWEIESNVGEESGVDLFYKIEFQ